jgi:membrane protein implicated in regulation of membrane protease activity
MWLALMAVLLIIEIISLGLTTIWFAVGALFAFLASLIGLHPGIQIAIFVVVSIVLLIVTRPIAVKYLNSRTTKTNAEAIVGKKVRVTKAINNLKGEGQVVVNGLEWTARSSDDTVTFKPDEMVTVVGIEGVKLIVKGQQEGE